MPFNVEALRTLASLYATANDLAEDMGGITGMCLRNYMNCVTCPTAREMDAMSALAQARGLELSFYAPPQIMNGDG